MKIKIREVKIGNNLISVMIDKHHDGVRTQSRLGIKYVDVPRTTIDREDKKAKKELVKKIVAKIELDSHYSSFSIDKDYKLKADFFEYCEEFIKRKAPISDVRTYKAVVNKLKNWIGKDKLICGAITESMMIEFKDFLAAEMHGISANNYFKKLKRLFKEATIAKYFKKNPIEEIINVKGRSAEKDILTFQEVKTLADTYCSNAGVKRAFLFCCFAGIRHCDTIRLKWENVKDGYIDIIQLKTKERLIVKLHDDAISLIGEKRNPSDLVFKLPTHTGCLKILKKWVGDAGDSAFEFCQCVYCLQPFFRISV
ncbi:MAG: site-specific integrase [Rhizobacter sp.]|nr:site-specific integrase [Ferruginibacter sp.]